MVFLTRGCSSPGSKKGSKDITVSKKKLSVPKWHTSKAENGRRGGEREAEKGLRSREGEKRGKVHALRCSRLDAQGGISSAYLSLRCVIRCDDFYRPIHERRAEADQGKW